MNKMYKDSLYKNTFEGDDKKEFNFHYGILSDICGKCKHCSKVYRNGQYLFICNKHNTYIKVILDEFANNRMDLSLCFEGNPIYKESDFRNFLNCFFGLPSSKRTSEDMYQTVCKDCTYLTNKEKALDSRDYICNKYGATLGYIEEAMKEYCCRSCDTCSYKDNFVINMCESCKDKSNYYSVEDITSENLTTKTDSFNTLKAEDLEAEDLEKEDAFLKDFARRIIDSDAKDIINREDQKSKYARCASNSLHRAGEIIKSALIEDQKAKADLGKPKITKCPTDIIRAISIVREFGDAKYEPDSWKKVDPQRYRDAMMRHALKYIDDPFGLDAESGLPHLWHLACNVAFLCYFDKDQLAISMEEKSDEE